MGINSALRKNLVSYLKCMYTRATSIIFVIANANNNITCPDFGIGNSTTPTSMTVNTANQMAFIIYVFL